MLNNRQAGRRRGRGGQRQQNGGRDNGNRIDNRARGNAPQLLEKYRTLARDAQLAGDRVMTEYYLQFADHYFRVVAESRARFEENRRPRDDWQSDEGEDGEDQGAHDAFEPSEGSDGEERFERQEREQRPRGERNGRGREAGRGGRDAGQPDEEPATIDVAVLPPAFGSDTMMPPVDALSDDEEDAPRARRRGRTRRPASEAEVPAEG